MAALARSEAELDSIKGLEAILNDDTKLGALDDARAIAEWLAGDGEELMRLMRATAAKPRLADLAKILELQRALAVVPSIGRDDLAAVCFFIGFAPHFHDVLEHLVRQYHGLKKPLVGYLFTRTRARAVDEELGQRLPCRSALEAHRKVRTLVRATGVLS